MPSASRHGLAGPRSGRRQALAGAGPRAASSARSAHCLVIPVPCEAETARSLLGLPAGLGEGTPEGRWLFALISSFSPNSELRISLGHVLCVYSTCFIAAVAVNFGSTLQSIGGEVRGGACPGFGEGRAPWL